MPFPMTLRMRRALPALSALWLVCQGVTAATALPTSWVSTWQASPQPVWDATFLFPSHVPAALNDQTVRQVVRVSLGGPRIRIVLSNAYGAQPLVIGHATVGRPSNQPASVEHPMRATFNGHETTTIPAGAEAVSDPIDLPVAALSRLVVSIHLPNATPVTTFHWDGRQTGWIARGDVTAAGNLPTDADVVTTTARLFLSGVQVEGPSTRTAVAVIGDSITDGATASLDADHRWPDYLAARLAPHGVAVVNAGISGARLLSDGMGVNALARFDRDVLSQPGVKTVIVMLGINDIAWPGTAFAPTASRPTLDAITSGYAQLISRAHVRGVRVIGATLTPFRGALPDSPLSDYYQPEKDVLRQQVNAWIRRSGAFDGVIDIDAVLRAPNDHGRMAASFDSGDHLHPGDAGNKAMSDAIPLDLLLPVVITSEDARR